jgi:hypothetical protein
VKAKAEEDEDIFLNWIIEKWSCKLCSDETPLRIASALDEEFLETGSLAMMNSRGNPL